MKAIVFDMDGVLFDTERISDMAWRKIAAEMGFEDVETAIQVCRGQNRNDTDRYLESHFPELDYPVFLDRCRKLSQEMIADHMPVKEGVYELLDWLKKQNWKIALATSTRRESTMHHLSAANMTEYFDAIITGEQVEHSKPAPDIYNLACEALEATPAWTFAVEDSPNGIRSAAAAKMRVIMVPDMVKPTLELREMCVVVLASLKDAIPFLDKVAQ